MISMYIATACYTSKTSAAFCWVGFQLPSAKCLSIARYFDMESFVIQSRCGHKNMLIRSQPLGPDIFAGLATFSQVLVHLYGISYILRD